MVTIEKGKVFAISGSSGSGKTTLVNRVLNSLSNFKRVKTYTTRFIRPGECSENDYHFLTISQFEKKIEEGFFIEYSSAYGNYYGSSKDSVKEIDLGISLIYILDYQGCLALKNYYSESKVIWIDVDIDILEERLIKRGDKLNSIKSRIKLAKLEQNLKKEVVFDYYIENLCLQKATLDLENYLVNIPKHRSDQLSKYFV